MAKNQQLIQDLNKMKLQDVNLDDPVLEKEDPKVKLFTVSNPVKISGHIKYKVSGIDSDGPFEETRRYKEFFALKNSLQ